MKAVPIVFDGIQFRSKLEARWYIYHRANGINVEYEPVDFYGWIPDFRFTVDGRSSLAEVKPVNINTASGKEIVEAYYKAIVGTYKDIEKFSVIKGKELMFEEFSGNDPVDAEFGLFLLGLGQSIHVCYFRNINLLALRVLDISEREMWTDTQRILMYKPPVQKS